MGNILVTGATGNVGKYVTEYLLEAGEAVKAAGTNKEKVTKLFGTCLLYTSPSPRD